MCVRIERRGTITDDKERVEDGGVEVFEVDAVQDGVEYKDKDDNDTDRGDNNATAQVDDTKDDKEEEEEDKKDEEVDEEVDGEDDKEGAEEDKEVEGEEDEEVEDEEAEHKLERDSCFNDFKRYIGVSSNHLWILLFSYPCFKKRFYILEHVIDIQKVVPEKDYIDLVDLVVRYSTKTSFLTSAKPFNSFTVRHKHINLNNILISVLSSTQWSEWVHKTQKKNFLCIDASLLMLLKLKQTVALKIKQKSFVEEKKLKATTPRELCVYAHNDVPGFHMQISE
ncbi:uncharacterized protein LOC130625236 [Hydractinia symbiolongicarpus]|uniref:uncharacterized protein LOC130625236 n=1 Tax=Hydractinia symbiolongicarpus TaxID=13093 RepID=UPI0025512379|nr:uncharacterized protein LOC130625236 [Hydractinia symbiolongicarpus]